MPSFTSGSTASRSYHGNPLLPRCYVSDLSSKSNHSPIRSVHIKPSPVETEPTDVLLGLPRGKPRNLVNRKPATRRHAPQLAPENLPCAASDAWLSDRDQAHAPPWRPPRPPIYRTWDFGPHPTIHAPSRATRISGNLFTRRWTEHVPNTRRTLLLMSSDVTRWRHHSTSAATQARPRQRHVIGWRQRIYCSTRDPTRKPGTDPDQYPLTLTLDQLTLTLTFCVDLWPKVKISDRAYLTQFFA